MPALLGPKHPKPSLFLILALLIALLISPSLSAQDMKKCRASVERYLKKRAHDPDSYKYIKLEYADKVPVEDVLKARISHFQRLNDVFPEEREYSDERKTYEKFKSLLSRNELEEPAYYFLLHTFRANNAFGALTMQEYWVLANAEDCIVYKMDTELENMFNYVMPYALEKKMNSKLAGTPDKARKPKAGATKTITQKQSPTTRLLIYFSSLIICL